ncbi:rRNA biogenesis protein rrp5 [Pseudolactococcus reticulitermitis]|uniref:rRNA biogenesis protein rrp5 n=1 Tax=Pseudolactococcus reticulitermitis TaxID=2025039 RepID=A0A224XF27_9LACT|nr:rRNA biogenesis protein rrp5 [Lactococcus reticulitermitis]GAX48502.1 hypothetical protein RsY01_2131 [Lactococcus reticulitermitis]
MSKTKLALEVVENLRILADSLQELCEALMLNEPEVEVEIPVIKPKPKAKTKAKAKESKLTLEAVRGVLAIKSQEGKTEQVRELIIKYGASRLSEVDVKHYKALLKEVEAL